MLSVLLTAAALAQTPCTWETPELKPFSAQVTSLADGATAASPFALRIQERTTGPRAKATLEADGGIALDLQSEVVRVGARVAAGQPVLYPTQGLDLGGGLSVGTNGLLSVIGVEATGVRVAASPRWYKPVRPTSAVLPCEGLTLVAPPSETRALGSIALVHGEHAIRATPSGPPIGTLSTANLDIFTQIQVLQSEGDQRQVQIDANGVRLVGWLPSTALREPLGGIGGLIGALGKQLEAPVASYICDSGTLYARSSDGTLGRVGELSTGAFVRVLDAEGEHRRVSLVNAGWLQDGSGRLVLQASALERCKVTEDVAVAQGAGSKSSATSTPGRISGEPLIIGALDKSHIDAVIKKHLSEVRNCYKDGLEDNPKLAGKVIVKFVISKDGAVTSAETKSSTLNDKDVEGCINERFLTFEFKKPEGGGIVVVSYPFVFAPG